MTLHSYTVHIEPAPEGGFWSQVPALPGCFSQGETIEAIELYLEDAPADEIP
jgi:predicted RNase H-like HicB family nuclease